MFAMNVWLWIATVLLLGMVPSFIVVLRGETTERFVGLQMTQLLTILVLVLLAQGFNRDIYYDIALAMAVLSMASGLVYARFLERWI